MLVIQARDPHLLVWTTVRTKIQNSRFLVLIIRGSARRLAPILRYSFTKYE